MTNTAYTVSYFATQALWQEVSLAPKPGLVDTLNSGAHRDMDIDTFSKSIDALSPFFTRYFQAGFMHKGEVEDLFHELRAIGQVAEDAMLEATEGINTHKGANFSFALILGACGYYVQAQGGEKDGHLHTPFSPLDSQAVLQLVSAMCKHLVEDDFAQLDQKKVLTHGERLFLEKGVTGIRGEAAAGYPALRDLLLPFLRMNSHLDQTSLLLQALVLLMKEVEDSNLIHRGGYAAWVQVKEESQALFDLRHKQDSFIQALHTYNDTLTERYLSPGGAADLLSLGVFFALLEGVV